MAQSGAAISTSGSGIIRSEPFGLDSPHLESRRPSAQDQGAYLEKTHIEFLTFSRSFFENVLAFLRPNENGRKESTA